MVSWNYCAEDGRNLPRSSAHSTIPAAGMISSLAEAILDRIKHDASKINIVPTAPLSLHERDLRTGSGIKRIIAVHLLALRLLEILLSGRAAPPHTYRFPFVQTRGFQSSGQAVSPHRYIH